ncbi:hypothetical protein [Lacrimispora xylanisolvens]|uniref:hypothetical protein n=1 Tax=Lacrimispora xylanisolvens TaxID=384636 RepID=UPI0032E7FAA4
MDMTREALQYVVGLSEANLLTINGDTYTDKDGVKVYTTDVVVEEQEFADGKNASSCGGSQPANAPGTSGAIGNDFVNIPDGVEDEGLPFN